jgi:hypothetical protein
VSSTPTTTIEPRALTPRARRSAWLIAIAADAIQLGLIPLFGEGWLTPFNDVLDVVVGFLLIRLLGWHLAFLPTFIAELLPVVDIFPSWTAAVWFATRSRPTAKP